MLHARVTSDGPDVLLVHGITDNLHTWDRVAPLLAGRARLHAVDLPGHGDSTVPDHPLRVAEMARALSDYLDTAAIERCVVVGNSLGGGVALMLAAREPARVRAVVTLGAIGVPFTMPLSLRLLRVWGAAEMMRVMARVPRLARPFMRNMFGRDYVMPRETLDAYWSGWRVRARPRYIRQLMRVVDVAEPQPILGEIRAPAHIVHGADDRVVPPRVARAIAAAVPHARLTLLARTGHAPQNERPDETAAIVTELL
jgi:pimeloyl-ACP methyl ester carboxylesterase